MKNIVYALVSLLLFVVTSCKKEKFQQAQEFGTVRFDNQTGLTELKLLYEGNLYTNGRLNNVKIPAGKGKFSFIDPVSEKSLLDTVLTIETNSILNVVLFKPSEDAKLVLLQNNQQDEPKPEANLMKVKIANLADLALPRSVDIVFYGLDDDIYDFVPLDTLKNVNRHFPDGYVILKNTISVNDPNLLARLLDSETQQPLNEFLMFIDNIDPNTFLPLNVFTIYIKDDPQGSQIIGSSYYASIGVLFKN